MPFINQTKLRYLIHPNSGRAHFVQTFMAPIQGMNGFWLRTMCRSQMPARHRYPQGTPSARKLREAMRGLSRSRSLTQSSGLHAHHEGLHKAGIRIGRRIRAPEATLATKMRKHHDIELARLDLSLTIPTHVRLMACVVGAMRTHWRRPAMTNDKHFVRRLGAAKPTSRFTDIPRQTPPNYSPTCHLHVDGWANNSPA